MKTLFNLLIIFVFLFITGCQPRAISTENAPIPSPDVLPASTGDVATSLPSENNGGTDMTDPTVKHPPIEKFVALSKKNLASRLQIDIEKITLVKTEEKNWLNAALGCPAPGVFYAQGRVPGYRIWLEAEGKEYDYHTDLAGQVILCPETNSSPTPHIGVPID